LYSTAAEQGVEIILKTGIKSIKPGEFKGFKVCTDKEEWFHTKAIIIAAGGLNKIENYNFISDLGIEIIPPVPSLFTFNIPDKKLHVLMGISTLGSKVKIAGTKEWYDGPILITHWGLSGPVVLKASSWLARELAEMQYKFTCLVDWTSMGEEKGRDVLQASLLMQNAKQIGNANPFDLPARLWDFILEKARVPQEKLCRDLSKPDKNRILENSIRCEFNARGKTTFKEEFVIAGGVSTAEINHDTMGSKKVPGLFFAGEIMDIDGITGGYNFQAAWATAYLAGSSAGKYLITA
jgi:predicted Rossmann fold flavoprotein